MGFTKIASLPIQYDFDRRQARTLTAATTMQNTLAGTKPSCAVRTPMTQMIALFTPDKIQPSQQRRPTRIVDTIVSTQER
jgi:hypothetical protein